MIDYTQMINLSEHFSLAEATISQTASRLGIDNSQPTPAVMTAASRTAVKLEKVRSLLGNKAISINSWIRCLELNRALGSRDTSQHPKGEAVDFICPAFGTPLQICQLLINNKELVRWDQLVLEHTWVHISWNSAPSAVQKGEILSLLSGGKYAIGLTNAKGVAYTA